MLNRKDNLESATPFQKKTYKSYIATLCKNIWIQSLVYNIILYFIFSTYNLNYFILILCFSLIYFLIELKGPVGKFRFSKIAVYCGYLINSALLSFTVYMTTQQSVTYLNNSNIILASRGFISVVVLALCVPIYRNVLLNRIKFNEEILFKFFIKHIKSSQGVFIYFSLTLFPLEVFMKNSHIEATIEETVIRFLVFSISVCSALLYYHFELAIDLDDIKKEPGRRINMYKYKMGFNIYETEFNKTSAIKENLRAKKPGKSIIPKNLSQVIILILLIYFAYYVYSFYEVSLLLSLLCSFLPLMILYIFLHFFVYSDAYYEKYIDWSKL
jgi:hypothetical protein